MDKKKIDKPDKVDELTANLIVLGSSNVKPLPNFVDYSIARNMIHRRPVDEKELKISINLKDVLNMEIHKLELSNNINNINNLMKNDYFNTLHKIFTKRLNDIIESEKALASEIEMIKQRIGLTDDEKKVFNSSGELPGTGNPDSSKSPVNEKKSPGLSKKIVVSGASLIGQSTKYLAHAGFSGLSYAWNKTVDTLNNDIKGNVKEAKFYSILHDTMKNIKNKNIEQIDTESRNAVINYSMFTNKIIPTIEWDTDSRALYNQKIINNLKGDNLSNMYKELSEKTAAEILPEFDSDKFWTKFGKIIKSSYNEVGRIQKFRFDCYTDFYNFLDKSEGIVSNIAKNDKDAQITLDRFKLYKSFIKDLIISERDNIILADCLENIVRSEKLHKIFTDVIEVNDDKYNGTQEQIILVIRDLYVNWVKVTLGLHSIWLNISEGKLLTPDNSKLLNSTSNITSEASRLKPYERQISRILLDIKMTSEGLSIINYLTNASEYPYTCLRILQDSSRVNIGLNETNFNAKMVFLGEMSTLTKEIGRAHV